MSAHTLNGSRNTSQDYNDRALTELLELVREFEALFTILVRERKSGHIMLRVDLNKGKISQMYCDNRDLRLPQE